MRNLSLLEYFRELESRTEPIYRFRAESIEEWKEWRIKLREKLWKLLGELPDEKVPLNPEILEEFERGGIVIRKVIYDVEENFSVPAYLLLPREVKGKLPAIVAFHGHGRGKEDVVGLVKNEVEYQVYIAKYNYDYAYKFARRGYIVLAPDGRTFGELSKDGVNCDWGFKMAILLGRTIVGLRVWDAMRSIDYLQSLPEVDSERIACIGLSWGGAWTVYTTALDDRVKVAVVSGYFGSFRDMLIERSCCICQYIPRIRLYADVSDIIALIAPRPLLIEYGTRDPLYTYRVVLEEFEKLKRVYKLLGAEDRLDIDIFEGGHMFSGKKAFNWISKWL